MLSIPSIGLRSSVSVVAVVVVVVMMKGHDPVSTECQCRCYPIRLNEEGLCKLKTWLQRVFKNSLIDAYSDS